MLFSKRKNAAAQQPESENPLNDLVSEEEYNLIFNCAFDGPRRFASH
jgi:hypothetical protein